MTTKEKPLNLPNITYPSDFNRPEVDEPFDELTDTFIEDYDPNDLITTTSSTKSSQPDLRRLNALYAEELKKTVTDLKERFRLSNPEANKLVFSKTTGHIRQANLPGYSKIPLAILDQMMSPGWLERSQKDILATVQNKYPDQPISKNTWTYAQKHWQLNTLRRAVANSNFRGANTASCKSLSDFRKVLRAFDKQTKSHTYKATIVITDATVTINNQTFKISTNKSNGKAYKRISVNVDTLLLALQSQGK